MKKNHCSFCKIILFQGLNHISAIENTILIIGVSEYLRILPNFPKTFLLKDFPKYCIVFFPELHRQKWEKGRCSTVIKILENAPLLSSSIATKEDTGKIICIFICIFYIICH